MDPEGATRLHQSWDAAKHPCQLIIGLSRTVASPDDIFPEVDEDLVQELEQQLATARAATAAERASDAATDATACAGPLTELEMSAAAIATALHGGGHWGDDRAITRDRITKELCAGVPFVDDALQWLWTHVMLAGPPHGPWRLNDQLRDQILVLVSRADDAAMAEPLAAADGEVNQSVCADPGGEDGAVAEPLPAGRREPDYSGAVQRDPVRSAAMLVAEALARGGHWGGRRKVARDHIIHRLCDGVPLVEEAIRRLLAMRLLLSFGNPAGGPYALDKRREEDIRALRDGRY